jgi:hypothetical protein
LGNNAKVGIGTSTPGTSLQVVDSDAASGTIRVGSDATWAGSETRRIFFGDGGFVYVGEEDADDRLVLRGSTIRVKNALFFQPEADNFTTLGGFGNRWTAVYAVNGTIQTSDARLKQGIKGLNYGLSQVTRLNPVSFRWKNSSDNRTYLGLLAQEVEKIIPEAVERNLDPSVPLGMNYSALVPVLVKAVQEQQAQVEAQQKQIDELKKIVCSLKPDAGVCKEQK